MTAPEYAKQKGRNDTWCVLAELSVPSEPGNERLAMERVAAVVKGLGLSEQRLERLKTAVAEATMNAIEHGNRRLPDNLTHPWFYDARERAQQHKHDEAAYPEGSRWRYKDITAATNEE